MVELLILIAAALVSLLWFEVHGVVLAFHSSSLKEEDAYTIRPRRAMRYIRLLRWLGYRAASVGELGEWEEVSRRRYLVTFDDGYRDDFHFILWLLRRGIGVVIFVPTSHLGGRNSWDDGNKRLMTQEELHDLAERGAVIASHGHQHRRMTEFEQAGLRDALHESLGQIERITGEAPRLVAYPYGAYDDRVLDVMREAGVTYGFTTIPRQLSRRGMRRSPLQLGRLSMRRDMSLTGFVVQLLLMRLRGWKQWLRERLAS